MPCSTLLQRPTSPVHWHRFDGTQPYVPTINAMQAHVAAIRASSAPESVWLLEHKAIYTGGTSASDDDLLTDYQELKGWNQSNIYYEKTYANDIEGGSAIVINSISYNYPSTDPNDDDTDSDERDISDDLDLRDGPEVRSDAIGNGYFTDPHVVDE